MVTGTGGDDLARIARYPIPHLPEYVVQVHQLTSIIPHMYHFNPKSNMYHVHINIIKVCYRRRVLIVTYSEPKPTSKIMNWIHVSNDIIDNV